MKATSTHPDSQYAEAAPSNSGETPQATTGRRYVSPTVCRLDLLSATSFGNKLGGDASGTS